MLNYSEEDIKNAAELRDWVLKQLSDKKEEIDRLKRLLLLIDNLLKQESFKPASKLERSLNNTASSNISAKQEQVNHSREGFIIQYRDSSIQIIFYKKDTRRNDHSRSR